MNDPIAAFQDRYNAENPGFICLVGGWHDEGLPPVPGAVRVGEVRVRSGDPPVGMWSAPRRRMGRPTERGESMQVYNVRLDPETRAWVDSQGGTVYVRRLIDEDRSRKEVRKG